MTSILTICKKSLFELITNTYKNKHFFLRIILLIIILLAYITMPIIDRLNYIKTKYQSIPTYIKTYSPDTIYNRLTDSFLSGQLHLSINPPVQLLALPDPYDPVANYLFRLKEFGDLSLYKGKFYVYFGITPVITLYIPYRLLTNHKLPDRLATLFFTFGSFIWAIIILLYIQKKFFYQVPEWMVLISIGVLGFANLGLFLMRGAGTYEIAISCGIFFLTSSVCMLIWINNYCNPPSWLLLLAGLFMGLSVGARPHYIIPVTIFILILYFKTAISKVRLFLKIKILFLLTLPFLLCLIFIATYNYLRFENITEFGVKYMLININSFALYHKYIDISYIVPNIYDYLFRPFASYTFFPFPLELWTPPACMTEKNLNIHIVGILPHIPFILLLVINPFIYYFIRKKPSSTQILNNNLLFPFFEFLIVFLPACINFIFLILFIHVQTRYIADFLTLLLLSNCIVWFYYYCRLENNLAIRRSIQVLGFIFGLISIFFGVSLTYTF